MTTRHRTFGFAALLIAGLLLLPASAAAQSVGVEGGLTFSQYDIKEPNIGDPIPSTSNLTGGSFGAFWVLSDGLFNGQIEALYTRRGTKTDAGTSVKVDYLEFPIGTRINVAEGQDGSFHLMAGAVLGFAVNRSQSSTEVFEIIDDDVDTFDTGLFVGAGFEAQRAIFNVRYYFGYRDVSDRPIELYNRGFQVMVGVKLN
jgi:hypothetical protein